MELWEEKRVLLIRISSFQGPISIGVARGPKYYWEGRAPPLMFMRIKVSHSLMLCLWEHGPKFNGETLAPPPNILGHVTPMILEVLQG